MLSLSCSSKEFCVDVKEVYVRVERILAKPLSYIPTFVKVYHIITVNNHDCLLECK